MPYLYDPPMISQRLQTWLTRSDASHPAGDIAQMLTDRPALTPAAVLVPIISHASEPTILFTQRTSHLTDHAGQISFPGGRTEPEDANMEETALRETEEEIGLDRGRVLLLGRLPEYITGTGFRVTPVVGWIEPGFTLTPDPFEVAEVFEVPMSFLLDPINHQLQSAVLGGRPRQYYAMPYESRYIWGATAGMLRSLYMALVEPEKV